MIRVLFFALLAVGCGPSFSETRLAFYPAREANCFIELLPGSGTAPLLSGEWELIGHVAFYDTGSDDPMSDHNRNLVGPRACAMGGEAVAILSVATHGGAVSTSSLSYNVFRRVLH